MFMCSAVGPELEFNWTTTANVPLPDPMNSDTSSTLTLTDVSAVYGGEYTCTVSNAAGSLNATAALNIAPEITMQPDDISTTNGSIEMLECTAEGFPEPTYQWLKHVIDGPGDILVGDIASGLGNESDLMGEYVMNATGPILRFDPVMFGDEGDYRCVASNALGSDTSHVATVTSKPIVSPSY